MDKFIIAFDGSTARLLWPYRWKNQTIPSGFTWDGLTIPRWLWWLVSPWEKGTVIAGLVHDWLYKTKKVNRKDADSVLFELCECAGWKRRLIWSGARTFGWIRWKQ